MQEAPMMERGTGKAPAAEGWFVMPMAEAPWFEHAKFGRSCRYDGDYQMPQIGINVRVLQPGQPNCYYHKETSQEDFFVLHGECTLLIEGEERTCKQWDLIHCPPDTEHVFVGAGDGPCVILMVGARDPDQKLWYPHHPVAAKHDAQAVVETDNPGEAYSDVQMPAPCAPAWPQ